MSDLREAAAGEAEPKERTAVYRIRGEAEVLLYIGMTNSPAIRWNGHQLIQPWWDELRSFTVEWYDSRPEAEAAERAAIMAEQPKYNVTYLKPTRLGRERKPLDVTPVETGVAGPVEPRDDDEDLMTILEVAGVARIEGKSATRKALLQTGGPTGFVLGEQILYRRRQIRQWIADVEASQQEAAA